MTTGYRDSGIGEGKQELDDSFKDAKSHRENSVGLV